MNDPLKILFQANTLSNTAFPPTSRYHGLETRTLERANGEVVVYIERRFIPQPDQFSLLQEHVVTDGERLDNITAHYLGDPEQFWQICDANAAMLPDSLTEVIGRRIRITLPEGVPGVPDA